MKKIIILAGILVCSISAFSQTIFIANSSSGAVTGVNTFTGSNAINLAIAAASNGDIIYLLNGHSVVTPYLNNNFFFVSEITEMEMLGVKGLTPEIQKIRIALIENCYIVT